MMKKYLLLTLVAFFSVSSMAFAAENKGLSCTVRPGESFNTLTYTAPLINGRAMLSVNEMQYGGGVTNYKSSEWWMKNTMILVSFNDSNAAPCFSILYKKLIYAHDGTLLRIDGSNVVTHNISKNVSDLELIMDNEDNEQIIRGTGSIRCVVLR
ncbi:MAG: hypothetical protein A3K03_06660 [Bdellovibrionales bacterium RIFOXYD1_FULL_44_7]|nr:MAG: hypothetical protein A3K03_06660 [Bdellovibrionales bacterium RIFOXYD1_FULL_44_7]